MYCVWGIIKNCIFKKKYLAWRHNEQFEKDPKTENADENALPRDQESDKMWANALCWGLIRGDVGGYREQITPKIANKPK